MLPFIYQYNSVSQLPPPPKSQKDLEPPIRTAPLISICLFRFIHTIWTSYICRPRFLQQNMSYYILPPQLMKAERPVISIAFENIRIHFLRKNCIRIFVNGIDQISQLSGNTVRFSILIRITFSGYSDLSALYITLF